MSRGNIRIHFIHICGKYLQVSRMNTERFIFIHNQLHNILRLFDVLPNFPFTTSEMIRDYYLQTWYIRVASQVAERLKT